jgi:hypothetical protein
MITVRPGAERGRTRFDWLDSYHSFSFGDYYDPERLGFRSLRVINEDWVEPGQGFGTHPHRDMEILTYVLEGALQHRDSLGSGSVIRPGEVQMMTAGTGVTHSEFNASRSDRVHLLQIWIIPAARGLKPAYAQKVFPAAEREGRLRVVASGDARDGSLKMNQDAAVLAALLEPGRQVTHEPGPGRHAWVQVARGEIGLNGVQLVAGDGAAASGEKSLELKARSASEILLFDLA